MTKTNFTIPGEPVPKARPKVTRWGTYTPKRTAEYEQKIKECYDGLFYEKGTPLKVTIFSNFGIPKSWSKKKTQEALDGKVAVLKRPDIDNLAKIIMDGLNGIAYHDDSQIVSLRIIKSYTDKPRVDVTIEPLI